ncbi:hypothetical protein HYQ46_005720 [Verticillium longisporum]|nr:hypothetical protein HYQ46_005720 [Verticillium longisporum]
MVEKSFRCCSCVIIAVHNRRSTGRRKTKTQAWASINTCAWGDSATVAAAHDDLTTSVTHLADYHALRDTLQNGSPGDTRDIDVDKTNILEATTNVPRGLAGLRAPTVLDHL